MNKHKRTYFGIIYSYINVINGKAYVGQTTRPKVRHKQHIQAALNNLDGSVFHKAIRKYGIQSFVYRIEKTIVCSSYKMYRKQIDFYETAFIKLYNSKERGYNMTNGGGNVWNNESKKGKSLSREHRRKISESRKKLHRTKNNSMENNPRAKTVICVDEFGNIIKTYNCAKYVCIDYPIVYSTLKKKLRENKCIINGLHFYYGNNVKQNF